MRPNQIISQERLQITSGHRLSTLCFVKEEVAFYQALQAYIYIFQHASN